MTNQKSKKKGAKPTKGEVWLGDVGKWLDQAGRGLVEIGKTLMRIRVCPEPKCRQLFVRVRKQVYCSRRCVNRANQREWRNR